MYQNSSIQPWNNFSLHYNNLVEKYNDVCKIVHGLFPIIKHLEERIVHMEKSNEKGNVKISKRCKFFNSGYCRNARDCVYSHSSETCQDYLTSGRCPSYITCPKRHPRECRHWKAGNCYRGDYCLYLHKKVAETKHVNVEEHASKEKVKKLITFELNGKKHSAYTTDELPGEVLDEMTADHILLFYENECGDHTANNFEDDDLEEVCSVHENVEDDEIDPAIKGNICERETFETNKEERIKTPKTKSKTYFKLKRSSKYSKK